jgi:serine palmitoyltransferase
MPARNKFTSLFGGGSSPKAREAALRQAIVAQQQALLNFPSPQQLVPINLPSISLTTAEIMPAEPRTLYQPPSPEEVKRLARAHAQFGPLGSQSHRCVSQFPGGEFAEPVEDEPPYYAFKFGFRQFLHSTTQDEDQRLLFAADNWCSRTIYYAARSQV